MTSSASASLASPSLPRLPARPVLLGLLWLGFVSYALFFAPPERGNTQALILDALFLRLDQVDAAVVAVFNLLGVWPAIYASVLLADGAGRRLPAWPFVLGSMFLGAFALLPYLVLRGDHHDFRGARTGLVRWFDSRANGVLLLVLTLVLLGLALTRGSLTAYQAAFQVEPLVHVMTIDFAILSLVFPSVLADDMARRGMRSRPLFWSVCALPLVGPAVYLAIRKPMETRPF